MNNLSEEEKKSIEILKDFSENENTAYCYDWNGFNYEVILEAITEVLNLIEKQQKELEQEKEKNKELEATLKQTQDSWYEDTKKIELNNECEIALNNRIIDLENELNKEKEKNKNLQDKCIELEEENIKIKHLMRNPCDIPRQIIIEKMNKDINTNEHTILGGRKYGKTLEYGIRLGRIQMCEELLQEGDDK